MKRAACLLAGFACIGLAACADSLGTWGATIPFPDATPIIELRAVTRQERDGSMVDLQRDLVLRGAFGRDFYRPRAITIAADGAIFVLDAGNHRVVGFDAEGEPFLEVGREGEGPGELMTPNAVGVAGDKIVIADAFRLRVTIFSRDGAHVSDHLLDERLSAGEMVGFEDHLVVVNAPGTPVPVRSGSEAPSVTWAVGVHQVDGTEMARLVETSDRAHGRFLSETLAGQLPMAVPHPLAALAAGGRVYASSGGSYQVVAVDPPGSVTWALRADSGATPVTEQDRDTILAALQARLEETVLETEWPDRFAAIVNLETDGERNLYVFPYDPGIHFEAELDRELPDRPFPVDVYSPAGERLFAGLIGLPSWDAQHGDRVCRIEPDPETAEDVVVCYRLVEPF